MGGGPKRRIKDIPLIIPKGSGGRGGRPEYEQLKECPDSFRVNLRSSDFIEQLKGGKSISLSVINEKEVKLMVGVFPVGTLPEKQARRITRCVHLGMKYQGRFHRQKTRRGLQVYAEFKRIA